MDDDIATLTEETKEGLNNLVTNLMEKIGENLRKENANNRIMYMGIIMSSLRESIRTVEGIQENARLLVEDPTLWDQADGGTASGRKIRSKTMRRQQRRGTPRRSRAARRQQRRGSRTMTRQQRRGTRIIKRNKRR